MIIYCEKGDIMQKTKSLFSVVVLLVLLINSNIFALSNLEQKRYDIQASVSVKKLVKENNLEIVDYEYVLNIVEENRKRGTKAIIIDARPLKKYQISHIPSALSLPDNKFETMYEKVLGKVDTTEEIIVYCGGYMCIKSPKVASLLQQKGHTNVKVYIGGMPQWIRNSHR